LILGMDDDTRRLHRSAIEAADEHVRRVTREDLGRPTPCASWTLADLLAHMVGQHDGFAAAVRDGHAPASAYAPVPYTPERWERSVAGLLAAFAAADLDGEAVEIELSPDPLPIGFIVGAQLLDTVVHTWDIARALGTPHTPADELVAVVARLAETVPDDERRDAPGAAFAHALPAHGTAWERALARLGRHANVTAT
jgi:uncharacterized protein (TIGR03086 family)